MFFFLIFFSFFQKGGSGFGIGPFTFFVNKFHRYSWFFASTVETCSHYNLWSISLYYCKGLATAFILLLSYILSGATYDRVRPSLFVSIPFIFSLSSSLSLSSGGLWLYLYHQEVLFNLIVCAVYLAASSLLATSVYMQVVNITSYFIRCQAMSVFLPWKKLFAVALLLPGPPWILSLSRSHCRLRELIFNWKRCWKTYFVVLLAMSKF